MLISTYLGDVNSFYRSFRKCVASAPFLVSPIAEMLRIGFHAGRYQQLSNIRLAARYPRIAGEMA
jgi:hypothetical protein